MLTKYSRQNGKVVWEKSTKEYYLQKPTLWQPEKEKVTFEDEQEINEPDNHTIILTQENNYIQYQL